MPSTATSILDGLSTSVAIKAPCRTVATSNITLAGLQTISGYTTVENDRVLVKGQTNAVENGIYMASTGNWTRARDADGNRDLVQGTRVLVRSTTIDGVEYELTTANPIVIGTTALTFELRYGANATYDQTEAEVSAAVTIVNNVYPEGYVDRYGTNAIPGTTDMTTAIQAAVNVAHAKATGGDVYFHPGTYLTSAAIVYPLTSARIFLHGNGAVMRCAHNGNGIDWVVQNENYSGHTIEALTITGPNTLLPAAGYVPPSTGAGINMNRGGTTNAVTAYNNVIRDVTVQGFNVGIGMQAVIGLNVFGSYLLFNQYGVYMDGGQTNANHFFGTHIRSNRKNGIRSQGTTGGSLTNATANTFTACLIESNIHYEAPGFPAGGTPPTNNTAIYLNNSYDFAFRDCYSENHSASIYLTGGSKGNKFINHRTAPGSTRIDQIILDGAGIYSNIFDLKCGSSDAAEVSVISNNLDQLYNKFTGEGINFVAGATLLGKLDFADVRPSLNYAGSRGVGVIRMPSQGYVDNPGEGTGAGKINGIGTVNASINAFGCGEIRIGSNITSNTIVTSISGVQLGQFLVLSNSQSSFDFRIDSGTINGSIGLYNGNDVILNQAGQTLVLYMTSDGRLIEAGRNFATPANAYTRAATVVESRALLANASATAANNNAVLAALLSDLAAKGIITTT